MLLLLLLLLPVSVLVLVLVLVLVRGGRRSCVAIAPRNISVAVAPLGGQSVVQKNAFRIP